MKNDKWSRQKIRRVLTPAIWVIGILYTFRSHYTGCPREVILGGWLIAPVVWLMLENWFLYEPGKDDWEQFKKWQWHQRNLWLGLAAFLAIKYLPLA
jgi:hypothetical protein